MSTSKPLILSSSAGKRAACDRCRGQKLRCIREDQNADSSPATCIRCFKAGATCSYDTGKRAGRSLASKNSTQERRGNGHKISKASGMTSRPTTNPSGQSAYLDGKAGTWQDQRGAGNPNTCRVSEKYIVNQESERETEDTLPIYAQSPLSLNDSSNVLGEIDLDFSACSTSSTATLPWPDEIVTPFSYQDADEVSGFEPLGSKYGWTLPHNRAHPMDIQVLNTSPDSIGEHHKDLSIDTYGIHAQFCSKDAQMVGLSDETMNIELLNTSAHTASLSPTDAVNARPCPGRDEHREWAQLFDSSGMIAPLNPPPFNDATKTETGIKPSKESLSVDEIQHRLMQELSELAMDLYAQLATNDPEYHQPTSGGTATALQDHLIGSVLKSSDTFLTLLSSFSTPATHSSSFTTATSYKNPIYDSSDSDTSTLSLASDIDDRGIDELVQHSYSKRPAGNSDDLESPPPIDMATVLQLLTCYIRIVHLHSIMHARMLENISAFLQHTAQQVDFVPPVFPNMQVGGVSLNRFGTFQIKLLLQISVHVLGEIESALGLPKEFRVGKSKGGRTGVLGESVSGEFVKCLMNERSWRGKKVESVKEQLRNLRRVVKRAIGF